jgi:hypothetical protein
MIGSGLLYFVGGSLTDFAGTRGFSVQVVQVREDQMSVVIMQLMWYRGTIKDERLLL